MTSLDATPPTTAAAPPTLLTRMWQRASKRFSTVGLAVGTLFLACSLTPSLLPRSVTFQGVVSGVSLGLGYGLGRLIGWLWSYLELPLLSRQRRRQVIIAISVVCAIVAIAFLARATAWQNSVRSLMGLAALDEGRPFSVGTIALLVFGLLHIVGWELRRMARFLGRTFDTILPRRVANVLGIAVAVGLFWSIANGILLAQLIRAVDRSSQEFDELIEDSSTKPTDPAKTGSAASLITWEKLGRMGRTFVSSGPTAAAIGTFHGTVVQEPIRVYVGMHAAETPAERAKLALQELIRVGGFNRSMVVLVTPTGTGWIDPASLDPLEYITRGDVATVAAQYSYLPSVFSLLTEASNGAEMARAMFEEIYGYWTQLPRDSRPRLYLHGVSLGSLNSDLSFDLFDVLRDPFDGAFWAGPPFRSRSWIRITEDRQPDSPSWLPRFRDGSVVRFSNQGGGLTTGRARWGPLRIAYLQYGSDPVTFFSASSLFREPQWLRTPRAPDVSPAMRWYPIITTVQVAADLAAGAEAAPIGFGHNYAPKHYIDAWLALLEPAGWTDADTQRLKAVFASYRNE